MDPNNFLPKIEFTFDPSRRDRPPLRHYTCTYPQCDFTASHYRQIDSHLAENHECRCGQGFANRDDLLSHECQTGSGGESISNDPSSFQLINEAHEGEVAVYESKFSGESVDTFEEAFQIADNDIRILISGYLENNLPGVLISFTLKTLMERLNNLETFERDFYGALIRFQSSLMISVKLNSSINYFNAALSLYKDAESGSRLKYIKSMIIKVAPIVGAGMYIKIPIEIAQKSLISIRTNKNCFQLSVLLGIYIDSIKLHENEDRHWHQLSRIEKQRLKRIYERPATYKKLVEANGLNFHGFEKEVSRDMIPEFEQQNPQVAINAYNYLGNKKFVIIHLTEFPKRKHVISLVLLNKGNNFHWAFARKPGILFKFKTASRDICKYCSKKLLPGSKKHRNLCLKGNESRRKYPFPEDIHRFTKMKSYFPPIFRIFFNLKKAAETQSTIEPDCFLNYSSHKGNKSLDSWAIVVLDWKNDVIASLSEKNGPLAMENFMSAFNNQIKECKKVVKEEYVDYVDSPELRKAVKQAEKCPICLDDFNSYNKVMKFKKPIIHHHHLSKELMAPPFGPRQFPYQIICSSCNIKIVDTAVVVISGNLNEDMQLLLAGINSKIANKFEITAGEGSKIISAKYNNFMILDARKFIDKSVNELGQWLSKREHPIVTHCVTNLDNSSAIQQESLVNALLGGVLDIPMHILNIQSNQRVEYSDIEKVYPDIPDLESLYESTMKLCHNKINEVADISFYNRLYLCYKVSLLAQVFSIVDGIFFKEFKISMLHSYTIHSYAMDCAMSFCNASYQYIKNDEMLDMVLAGIKGPLESSITKYSESLSERMGDKIIDERKEIIIQDLNMVYLGVVGKPLAIGGYEWVQDPKIEKMPEGFGRVYEVDMVYGETPEQQHFLQDRDNQLVLCPYKRHISTSELSNDQKSFLLEWRGAVGDPLLKFRSCLDFGPRDKLVIHHRALDYYISRGLVVKKVHRAIQFEEKPILAPITDLLASMRRKYRDDKFISHLVKVLAVSIYGCCLKNTAGYTRSNLSTTKERTRKLKERHNFLDFEILNQNLVLFQLHRCSWLANNPYLWALSILDDSKVCLYQGWERVQKTFDDPKAIMVQTDSIFYSVNLPKNDLYARLKSMSDIFDFSNLDKSHPLYSENNAVVPLKWKLQSENTCCPQGLVRSVCSLRPKLYSVLYWCPNKNCETKKILIKGLTQEQKNRTSHDDFKLKLQLNAQEWQDFKANNKRAWHALDVNRYLCPDHINTLAFNHYKIQELK